MNRPSTVRAAAIAALLLGAACSDSSPPPADPCAPTAIPAGLGCEFWPTVTANAVDGFLPFGVALVNPGTADVAVRIEGGALGAGIDVTVPGGASSYRTLPWVNALKACSATGAMCTSAAGTSVLSAGGAYHLTSSAPIAVRQYSPVPGADGPGSAGASALPGAHALGKSYLVAAWTAVDTGYAFLPGFAAITATEDGTNVAITPAVPVEAGALAALAAGAATSVALNRGDVLELLAYAGDLTGTRIVADKPVQVVGGHFCAFVPTSASYCDHLEEVLPPVSALGTSYVVAPPSLEYGKPIMLRVVATADGTALSYSTAISGAPATLAAAGDHADVELSELLEITSNHPVLVATYMEGATRGTDGDPSLAIAAPVARWRTSYQVDAPPNVPGGTHVDVIAPQGATIRMNGDELWLGTLVGTGYAMSSIGFTGQSLRLEGDVPFAISVYVVGPDWSFWYVPAFAP